VKVPIRCLQQCTHVTEKVEPNPRKDPKMRKKAAAFQCEPTAKDCAERFTFSCVENCDNAHHSLVVYTHPPPSPHGSWEPTLGFGLSLLQVGAEWLPP